MADTARAIILGTGSICWTLALSCIAMAWLEGLTDSSPDGLFGLLFTVVGGLVLLVLSLPGMIIAAVLNGGFQLGLTPYEIAGILAALPFAVALFAILPTLLRMKSAAGGAGDVIAHIATLFAWRRQAIDDELGLPEHFPHSNPERAKEETKADLSKELDDLIAENKRSEARIKKRQKRS